MEAFKKGRPEIVWIDCQSRNQRVKVTFTGTDFGQFSSSSSRITMAGLVNFARSPGIRWRQIYAAFAANLAAFSFGCVWVWTSTALPSLKEEGSLGEISKTQEKWITSVIFIGSFVAAPIAGFMMDQFGRRLSMLISTPFMVAGWLLIVFAQNVEMVYAGRFLTGLCGGFLGGLAPVYIAETAERDIRGMLVCGFDPSMALGMLFIFIVGSYTTWTIQAIACTLPPVTSHLMLTFAPESPRFLLQKGRTEDAKSALSWLRNSSSELDIKAELQEITDHLEENQKPGSGFSCSSLFRSDVIKPTLIGCILFFFHQASGNYAILAYTVEIFRSAGSDDEYLHTTLIGVGQAVGALAPLFLVERFGRRILLLVSEALAGVTLAILGLYFYLQSQYGEEFVSVYNWIPVATLFIHEFAFSLGVGPIPFLLMGELAPPTAKGISTSLMTVTVRLMGFLVLYEFNDLMDAFGFDFGYWFLACMCALGIVFVYLFVPETKGKSLEQIHASFVKKNEPSQKL